MTKRNGALLAGVLAATALTFTAVFAQPPAAGPAGKAFGNTATTQGENAGAVAAAPVFAPPAPGPTLAVATPIGQPLFAARCASCHEPATGRTPDREQLRARSAEAVLDAVTDGPMRAYAEGLNPQQMRALSVFVANKAFSPPNQQIADNMCATHPAIRMTPSSWNGWMNGVPGNRYQPNPGFRAADAPKLKVKWAFALPTAAYGQPTVIGDHLFLTTISGAIYALDAKTGCVHWRATSPVGARTTLIVERRPGASPSGWVAYYGDSRGSGAEGIAKYHAIDAQSGQALWSVEVERHPFARLTGSPVIVGDHMYIPTSSFEEGGGVRPEGCCTFAGAMVKLDLKTHRVVWKTKVMDPRPTRRNMAGGQMYGPAGGAMWMAPVVDLKRKALYVGTGDSYTEAPTDRADAIVAFDMETGAIKWTTQTTANDNFMTGCPRGPSCPLGQLGPDHDFGASPVLVSAGGKDILLIGQKSSQVHAVDPDTGRLLWQKTLGVGSALGGIEWGMASDGRLAFAANSDQLAGARGRPALVALNPANGETVWRVDTPKVECHLVATTQCRNTQSAAVSAMPGLVFSGSTDGRLRAYQSADGKIVWDFDTTAQTYTTVNGVKNQPGGNIDTVGPTIAGGMIYAISGYVGPGVTGGNPVNVLLAFSVDGK